MRPPSVLSTAPAELLCFLRDAVDTRKPPLMEVALDCIQKLISFKLLQGPVHHINHRYSSVPRCSPCLQLASLLLRPGYCLHCIASQTSNCAGGCCSHPVPPILYHEQKIGHKQGCWLVQAGWHLQEEG